MKVRDIFYFLGNDLATFNVSMFGENTQNVYVYHSSHNPVHKGLINTFSDCWQKLGIGNVSRSSLQVMLFDI